MADEIQNMTGSLSRNRFSQTNNLLGCVHFAIFAAFISMIFGKIKQREKNDWSFLQKKPPTKMEHVNTAELNLQTWCRISCY